MTNIKRFIPPWHRRHNWFLVVRKYHVTITLLIFTTILVVVIKVFLFLLEKEDEKAAAILNYSILLHNNFAMISFGKEGFVITDWIEDTTQPLPLRRIK